MTDSTNEQIKNIKEEIFKEIRLMENKINTKIDEKFSSLNELKNETEIKYKQILNKSKEMLTSMIDHQIKIEKIVELEQFKNKINDMIITHEIRINNSIDDINTMKAKYDKTIIDNLTLPSFINTNNQFKNIGEYIIYNINEVNKLKVEKDLIRKDIKETRVKIDALMATTLSLVNNSVARCHEYCKDNINSLSKSTDTKFREVVFKFDKMEDLIKNNQSQLQNQINKINKDISNINNNINTNIKNDIAKIKPEYTELIEQKTKIFPPMFKEINKKIDNVFEKLSSFKITLNKCDSITSNFDNTVKDIRSRYVKIFKDIYHNKNFSSTKVNPLVVEKNKDDENSIFNKNDSNKFLQNFMHNTENSIPKINPKKRNSVVNFVNYKNFSIENKALASTKDDNNNKSNSSNSESIVDEEQSKNENMSNRHLEVLSNLEKKITKEEIKNNCSDILDKKKIKSDVKEENRLSINLSQIKEKNSSNESVKKISGKNSKKKLNEYSDKNKNKNNSMSQITKMKTEELSSINLLINKKQNFNKNNLINKKLLKPSSQDIPLINNNPKSENKNIDNIISKKSLKKEKKLIKIEDSNEIDYAIESYCHNNNSNINNSPIKNKTHKLASLGYNSNHLTDPVEVYSMAAKRSNKKRLINLEVVTSSSNKLTCYNYPKANSNDKKTYKIGSVFGRTAYNFYNKKEEVYNNLTAISQNMNKNEKYHENDINITLAPVAKLKMYKDI